MSVLYCTDRNYLTIVKTYLSMPQTFWPLLQLYLTLLKAIWYSQTISDNWEILSDITICYVAFPETFISVCNNNDIDIRLWRRKSGKGVILFPINSSNELAKNVPKFLFLDISTWNFSNVIPTFYWLSCATLVSHPITEILMVRPKKGRPVKRI